MRQLWIPDIPWFHLIIRAVIVYLAILVLLRVAGKRQIGQMGMIEFVALLLISNAVQNSMNGGDNSITGGIILAVTLIVLSALFARLTYRSRKLEMLIQSRPTLLIHHGKILHDHLKRELLTVRELKQLLRRQGIHDLDEIAEAVLESDGFISITKRSEVEAEYAQPRNDVY
jgi:uncharacterized membrane protein YcaP (DUF421 family)